MGVKEDLEKIFSTYPDGEYPFDTLEISHSEFSTTYYLTREPAGVVVDTEVASGVFFEGVNMDIGLNNNKSDLDKVLSFTIPDVDNILDDELARIPLDSKEPIKCIYRAYNNTNLTEPSFGPLSLDAVDVSQEKGRFTILASASLLNWNTTGLRYDYDKFPPLRALL